MAEHSLLFMPDMVRALRSGRKTVTRRLGSSVTAMRMNAGERAWVKEAFAFDAKYDSMKPSEVADMSGRDTIIYKADGIPERYGKLRFARGMPRALSRMNVELIDVRLEPLWDITGEDAVAEGIEINGNGERSGWRNYLDEESCYDDPRLSYASLWDSINGKPVGPKKPRTRWQDNPTVFRVEFKVLPDGR